jgi:hypothetical protein
MHLDADPECPRRWIRSRYAIGDTLPPAVVDRPVAIAISG